MKKHTVLGGMTMVVVVFLLVLSLSLCTSPSPSSQPNSNTSATVELVVTETHFSGEVIAVQRWAGGMGGAWNSAIYFADGTHTGWFAGQWEFIIGAHYTITIEDGLVSEIQLEESDG